MARERPSKYKFTTSHINVISSDVIFRGDYVFGSRIKCFSRFSCAEAVKSMTFLSHSTRDIVDVGKCL